jgi:signal transduction histidine kinase
VLKIIDALLLLAGISGRPEVERHPLNNMSILIHQMLKQRLADQLKQCAGEVKIPDRFPCAIGYAPWVEEVWVNYLSNGLKYGGQPPRLEVGADEIRCSSAVEQMDCGDGDDGQKGRFIRFWVRDNGQGLSLEMRNKLFVPFTRLHKNSEGHGLGLSIVREIVEKLGGTVGVESEVGQGSVFYFTLPACRDQRKE